MSSKIGEIGPWTAELAALGRLVKKKSQTYNGENDNHIFFVIFHLILFILAGNEDKHKSLDEFEIRPYPTTGFHGNR